MTEGYAITGPSGIDIRTVSDTRRAAIINWLVVQARHMIHATDTDEQIERLWAGCAGKTHQCIRVLVQPSH